MSKERILVVEDEADLAEVLRYNLEQNGFEVETLGDGEAAWAAIQAKAPDLLILDLMLPGLDGLELTRLLKRQPETSRIPILMLTAKAEEIDRIVGLELGADDYLAKPFSNREVVLRAKAILRRAGAPAEEEPHLLSVGAIRLDVDAHQAWVDEREIQLTATEFRLLRVLMERPGRVQSRSRLLADVWGYSEDVDSRTVDTHIRRLRRKLGAEVDPIDTVIGVGYRFHAE